MKISSNCQPLKPIAFKSTPQEYVKELNYVDSKTYEPREWALLSIIGGLMAESVNAKKTALAFATVAAVCAGYEMSQRIKYHKEYKLNEVV